MLCTYYTFTKNYSIFNWNFFRILPVDNWYHSIIGTVHYSFHAVQAACKPFSQLPGQFLNHSAWFPKWDHFALYNQKWASRFKNLNDRFINRWPVYSWSSLQSVHNTYLTVIAVVIIQIKIKTHDINEQVFTSGGHHLTVKTKAQCPHLPAENKQREMRLHATYEKDLHANHSILLCILEVTHSNLEKVWMHTSSDTSHRLVRASALPVAKYLGDSNRSSDNYQLSRKNCKTLWARLLGSSQSHVHIYVYQIQFYTTTSLPSGK